MSDGEKKSMLCPNCRKLISRDEPACPYCGLSKPGWAVRERLLKFSLLDPDHLIQVILYANIAFFVLSVVLDVSDLGFSANPFRFFSPSPKSLILLGASGTIPIDGFGRWWTVITASFLHGGILHIFFNMAALWQLGPFVMHEFGASRFAVIYLASGIAGFVVSYFAGVSFTLGASASVCGLIGAILYYGKSRGGYYGQAVYKQAMGWTIGLILFGLLVQGINNWAHGGGLVSGIVLALILGYHERKKETMLHKILAGGLILVTVIFLGSALLQAVNIRFFAR
ncbi:MAG TPA: rhomboid family intramembrane serine protease [Syntrophales bacterium]|nr:rhomboid family intramembrane serine protease [Syntrophales bacterium]HOX93936.1 rhomboid family intramembrane serine protease [Syntrophales bacterium]HPI56107.1 rhomboid family intramembrane serine protease [Syntrophales bacterium]HPN24003.1 rhomboid family intramembrane serine protease [Syntrophales bacterium]HQM28282.1 rhomboid family intramembrane serine protease [Syntrophales bacterium]